MTRRRHTVLGTIVLLGALLGGTVEVAAASPAGAPDAVVVVESSSSMTVAGSDLLDDDLGEGGDSDGGIAPLLGGLVLLGSVFALGLAAIRRQRAEGRRSKLPPIG